MFLLPSHCFPELYKQRSDPDCLSLGFMVPQIAEQNHFLFFPVFTGHTDGQPRI